MRLRWYQEEAVQALFNFFDEHKYKLGPDGKPIKANPVIAMPTGTGKSLVIGEFLRRALHTYPRVRAVMATHVKELIEQNANKMLEIWPHAPLGIYSAGLNQRDVIQPIIFGGIKSMVGKFPIFGFRDFLVVDEAHLVGTDADTSYLKFIKELTEGGEGCSPNSHNVNPYLNVILLTATPYRMGLGHLTNGDIATHVAFDLCNIEGFNRLMAEGYLCPLIPQPTQTEFDLSGVGFSKGDYIQSALEAAVDKDEVTFACLQELVQKGWNRRSWLIFASGIHHAEAIGNMLNTVFGIPTVVIHSKKTDKQNEAALKAWKSGEVRCAVNMNSLTTGVDHPACDLIGMMRATISTGLWVQMLGRGTRPLYAPGYDLEDFVQRMASIRASGKENCLVLDFAGNIKRLGPINDPLIPRLKSKGPPGDAPIKQCPACKTWAHTTARFCIACGNEFTFDTKLSKHAANEELIRSELPQIETFKVQRVVYSRHVTAATRKENPNLPDHLLPFTIKVSYYCEGLKTFYDYKSLEGEGYNSKKGRDWFRQICPGEPPKTNADVLQLVSQFRAPAQISVWVNTKYPRVMGYEF